MLCLIRNSFALFLLIFAISPIIAQSKISGTIIDKDTQKPVLGASVFIDNTTLGVVTDQFGNFEITNLPEGFNKIVVNKIGFKSYTGNATSDRVLSVELKPDLLTKIGTKDKSLKK